MSISHQALRRLLEEAFDEYGRHRALGIPGLLARERAIEAALSSVESDPGTGESGPQVQLELPLVWRNVHAAPSRSRAGRDRPPYLALVANEEEPR